MGEVLLAFGSGFVAAPGGRKERPARFIGRGFPSSYLNSQIPLLRELLCLAFFCLFPCFVLCLTGYSILPVDLHLRGTW